MGSRRVRRADSDSRLRVLCETLEAKLEPDIVSQCEDGKQWQQPPKLLCEMSEAKLEPDGARGAVAALLSIRELLGKPAGAKTLSATESLALQGQMAASSHHLQRWCQRMWKGPR